MSNETDSNIIRMVDRACVILEQLYMNEGAASISVLAKELELPKANVFRILYTLQKHGVVEKEKDSDHYRLGKNLIRYGEKVKYELDLVDRARPLMKATAMILGESINIGIEHEGQVVTLHSEEGEKSVLVSRLIPVAELHCSSMGKLILAEMSDDERKHYFHMQIRKRTVNTLVTLDAFEKELPMIKQEQLAYDREEYEYGLSCIAAPIRDDQDQLIAMISVSGPTTRLEFKGMKHVIDELKKLAKEIEQVL